METTATANDAAAAGDELHALRKYIVDMMHVEMELMEQIKQKEDSLETAAVRIHHFKDLVTQEQSRNKSLRVTLNKDLIDLEVMEGQKILADAKHKQFQDTVRVREREVENLQSAYSEVRCVILRLQQHLRRLEVESQHIVTQDGRMSTETEDALLQLEDLRLEPDTRQGELQNQRAKKKKTCEEAAQLEKEAINLTAKRSNLEEEQVKAEKCIKELSSSLKRSEIDTEKQRQRIHDDISNIRKKQKVIAEKLAKKQTKFRKMTKTEIASLRRRISFVQSELEKIQMEKEDTLSVVFALTGEHGILNDRIMEQSNEIQSVEKLISDLGEKIATFDRCESKFNKFEMQQDLAIKEKQIDIIQRGLKEKQQMLQESILVNDQSRQDLKKLTDEADGASTDNVDERLRELQDELKEQEGKKTELHEVLRKGRENYAQLKARISIFRRTTDQSKKRISSLKKKHKTLALGEAKLRQHLQEEESLLTVMLETLKTGEMLHAELSKKKENHEKEKEIIENELENQEKSWAKRCLEEEAKLNLELQAWDAKIKFVQDEISAR